MDGCGETWPAPLYPSIKCVSLRRFVQYHDIPFYRGVGARNGARDLLNDDERQLLFGVPEDHDSLVKLYTLSRTEGEQALTRRAASNRLGFAVQMALLRHPGIRLPPLGYLDAFPSDQPLQGDGAQLARKQG